MPYTERHSIREEALAKIQAASHEITAHVANARKVQTVLLTRMASTSQQTLYRFEKTEAHFLKALETQKNREDFLSNKGQHQSRLFVGRHIFNKAGFADYLLKKAKQGVDGKVSTKAEEPNRISEALTVLRMQSDSIQTQLVSFRKQRESLAVSVRELLTHVRTSERRELLPRNSSVASDIEACAWFAFDEGAVASKKRADREKRAKSLFEAGHITQLFTSLTNSYLQCLERQLPIVLKRMRGGLLRRAAKNLVAELESDREFVSGDKLEVKKAIEAIVALHFAFACEQHLDSGKMPPGSRMEYEHCLRSCPTSLIEQALTEIINREILQRNDLNLLRYVESVQNALNTMDT